MKKAFVFDFDDTLAVTDCMVHVTDHDGNVLNYLTPTEFNVYKLDHYEYFDFCEFNDRNYIKNAEPTFLIHLAKEVYDEGHKVYILTARSMEVIDAIWVWMKSHGIEVDTVHCITDRMNTTRESVAERKKRILLDIVANHDKIYFYDDSEENVNVFTHEKLRAYQV